MIIVNDNGIYRDYNEADLAEEIAFPDAPTEPLTTPEQQIAEINNKLDALTAGYREGVNRA